jgi:hypothetical protein
MTAATTNSSALGPVPIWELAKIPAMARNNSAMPSAGFRETERTASSRRSILRRSLSSDVFRTLAAPAPAAATFSSRDVM